MLSRPSSRPLRYYALHRLYPRLWLMMVMIAMGCAGDRLVGAAEPESDAEADTTQQSNESDGCAAADPQVIELLDQLEQRGREIETLQAGLQYLYEQELLGDRQLRIGKLIYAGGERSRFRIDLQTLVINDEMHNRPWLFIFDGEWLAEVQPQQKLFIRRQVVAPGTTYNPLRLGEGPFPVPLGQRREEVLAAFNVKRVEPAGDDDAELIHLRLTPHHADREQTSDAALAQVDLWYDQQTLLPRKIITVDDSENRKTVTLHGIRVNELDTEQAEDLFDTSTPPDSAGYRVEVKPWEPDEASQ